MHAKWRNDRFWIYLGTRAPGSARHPDTGHKVSRNTSWEPLIYAKYLASEHPVQNQNIELFLFLEIIAVRAISYKTQAQLDKARLGSVYTSRFVEVID